MSMNMKFVTADELAEDFGISKAHAYKLIRQLNEELSSQGYITIAGRVSRQYYLERVYGGIEGRSMGDAGSQGREI